MAKLAAEKDPEGIPKSQRQPVRPSADAVLADVAKVFGIKPEEVKNRASQPAFQTWVYLLRRAANLSLRDVAERACISPGRISQIQRATEAGKHAPELKRLALRYHV